MTSANLSRSVPGCAIRGSSFAQIKADRVVTCFDLCKAHQQGLTASFGTQITRKIASHDDYDQGTAI